MNRKNFPRRALVILIGLVVVAVAIRAVIRFADAHISYTDEAVDIELVAPAEPPQQPAPAAN